MWERFVLAALLPRKRPWWGGTFFGVALVVVGRGVMGVFGWFQSLRVSPLKVLNWANKAACLSQGVYHVLYI